MGDIMLDFMSEQYSSWEKIKNSGLPVVVYGMGNGADKVIDEFIRLGIQIKGVTASDDFVRGQVFRGFTVKKLSEFDGDFIIAIAFASSLSEVMNRIYDLEKNYRVLVPVVPVYGNDIFNREFITENRDKMLTAFSAIEDKSKDIFSGCVDFMFGGELSVLKKITTDKSDVFSDIIKLGDSENYLDLGAYRGDTVDEFIKMTGGKYSFITALEPDRKTYKKLCENTENLMNCRTFNKAVYSCTGEVCFQHSAGRQSAVSKKGTAIETVTIDDLFGDCGVSYIKADIEGSEKEALLGGIETLKKYKPKLNIALYHKSRDIFELPLLIKSINPEYKLYIAKHPYIPCWDMNLYCV